MRFRNPPQLSPVSVVKTEDKERKLKEFITLHLERLRSSDAHDLTERTMTVLARSPESPVAKSVMEAFGVLTQEGIGVRCVFTRLDPPELLAGWLTPAGAALRWVKHPKLLDAHEQMVIGTSSSWIGDCMRREPAKRDAFEQFHLSDPGAAKRASYAFRQIWSLAEPLPIARVKAALRGKDTPKASGATDSLNVAMQHSAESQPHATGATRH